MKIRQVCYTPGFLVLSNRGPRKERPVQCSRLSPGVMGSGVLGFWGSGVLGFWGSGALGDNIITMYSLLHT